ncbi:hypothetical protein QAD02_013745 [Eretmocerus hayati]|uniref:Uncharacterized protein n=1 Tax=Eretmocerus hayati TaxID=131215 RepID=A0ACC2P4C6_9HYME|nr:hypothetical protein QAD02_013745 [Eretmocerus hayati]
MEESSPQLNIASTVARMNRQCIIRLTRSSFCFNITDDNVSMVWIELDSDKFFEDYVIAGKSQELDEIHLELNAAMLSKSVTSLKCTAKSVKIKLTHKKQPCLTFEIELPSMSVESRLCVHDVPVTVIPPKKWHQFSEPCIAKYDISLEMPQCKPLKNVVDRMRNMSSVLSITADERGVLAFSVDSDMASITVHFPDLRVFECTTKRSLVARVGLKKFHSFLLWDFIQFSTTKFRILSGRMINIQLELENHLLVKYYITTVDS